MESGFWDYLGGQKYAATSAGVSREVIFGLNLSLVQSSKPEECSSADQIYKKMFDMLIKFNPETRRILTC